MPKGVKIKSSAPSDVEAPSERKETVHLNCTNLKNFEDLSIGDKVSLTVRGEIKSLDEHQYDREEIRRSLSVEIDTYDVKKAGSIKGKSTMEKAYDNAEEAEEEEE